MFDHVKSRLLPLLRIPPEPAAPAGAPGSLRTFRAAPNYYRLRLILWGFGQVAGFIGLVIALVVAHATLFAPAFRHGVEPVGLLLVFLEALGVLGFFLQIPFTYAAVRLDYELRWYLVTDRSLRIRSGIWTVEELTMTFANIQELTIHQGPLQRLLGIADLKVRSAGGGVAKREGEITRETHVAYFHGVADPAAIRDLILAHVRRLRDTGLGDPDSPAPAAPNPELPPAGAPIEVLAAAREVLTEVRALRNALSVAVD